MDFRIRNLSRFRRLSMARDGLRLVAERSPQAHAFAVSEIERIRPFLLRLFGVRRKIATIAVGMLAAALFVHVLFGANGMVVYKQKRDEFESLRHKIIVEQNENELYTQQIQGLKSDQKAIEKEAREQLHYARPGEYVYVPQPPPANVGPPISHSARK